jgi:hypothetical protein
MGNSFAAATPFAGCGDPTKAERLIQTPFWILDIKSIDIRNSFTLSEIGFIIKTWGTSNVGTLILDWVRLM